MRGTSCNSYTGSIPRAVTTQAGSSTICAATIQVDVACGEGIVTCKVDTTIFDRHSIHIDAAG